MIEKLTHTEACKLVEDALERVGKTLAYIRLKLAEDPKYLDRPGGEMKVKAYSDEANLLCNINWYGAYLQGARSMALALQNEWNMLDFPLRKCGHGNYKGKSNERPEMSTRQSLTSSLNPRAILNGAFTDFPMALRYSLRTW